jgi:hypothetical protein
MRKHLFVSLIGLTTMAGVLLADEKNKPEPPPPAATITLLDRHGQVLPHRQGFHHTGGGNIDVAQPTPDALVITMTGVAVAGGHPFKDSSASQDFDVSQCFEVALEKANGKNAKLTLEARVIGLLRSHCKGGGVAEETGGCATIGGDSAEAVALAVPSHAVSGGESLSVNDHIGPITVALAPGKYTLHQAFRVAASHPRCAVGKAASAEFAPDPALDPLWISYFEPFHGASKKDFGFQVTIKVAPE